MDAQKFAKVRDDLHSIGSAILAVKEGSSMPIQRTILNVMFLIMGSRVHPLLQIQQDALENVRYVFKDLPKYYQQELLKDLRKRLTNDRALARQSFIELALTAA